MAKYTSPEDENFFGAIGRLTISWAHLELGLDGMVEIVHHALGGREIEPEIPRALGRKITYLRAVFKGASLPDDAIASYLSFLDRVETASQTRHDVIHGVVVEYAERSGEASMIRALRHRRGVTKRQYQMTTVDILRAAREAQQLGGHALKFVVSFYELVKKLVSQQDNR